MSNDLFGSMNTYSDSYSYDFFSAYNNTSNSSSSGISLLSSSLLDLQMIQSGVYKKALQAYYAKNPVKSESTQESIKESGKADSSTSLSTLKSAAQKMVSSTSKLQNTDYSKVETAEDLLDDVKDFVSNYNSTINATKNLNSYSILQTAVWMTGQTSTSSAVLSKIGITINDDNTLSLDEDKFKEANVSTLKSVFSGYGSFASRLAQRASSLSTQSANQIAVNTGKTLYTSSGTY